MIEYIKCLSCANFNIINTNDLLCIYCKTDLSEQYREYMNQKEYEFEKFKYELLEKHGLDKDSKGLKLFNLCSSYTTEEKKIISLFEHFIQIL